VTRTGGVITTSGFVAMSREVLPASDTIIMAIALFFCLVLMLGLLMLAARHPYNDRPYPGGQWDLPLQGEVIDTADARGAPREGTLAHAGTPAARDSGTSGTERQPEAAGPPPGVPGQEEPSREPEQQAGHPLTPRGGLL